MARALINLPANARRGEIITIKTLLQHKMESGFRYSTTGARIPRDIVTKFVVTYDGDEIFRADLSSAIAANPFIVFHTKATVTGTIVFTWTGDNGFTATEEARLTVT